MNFKCDINKKRRVAQTKHQNRTLTFSILLVLLSLSSLALPLSSLCIAFSIVILPVCCFLCTPNDDNVNGRLSPCQFDFLFKCNKRNQKQLVIDVVIVPYFQAFCGTSWVARNRKKGHSPKLAQEAWPVPAGMRCSFASFVVHVSRD